VLRSIRGDVSQPGGQLLLRRRGGAWALPFREERSFTEESSSRQIRNTKAELVVTSCHNCRDQILKSLRKEYNLDVEVKYIWELVSDALILEPKQGHEG